MSDDTAVTEPANARSYDELSRTLALLTIVAEGDGPRGRVSEGCAQVGADFLRDVRAALDELRELSDTRLAMFNNLYRQQESERQRIAALGSRVARFFVGGVTAEDTDVD